MTTDDDNDFYALTDLTIPTWPIHIRNPAGKPLCGAEWIDSGAPNLHPMSCWPCEEIRREWCAREGGEIAYGIGGLVRGDAQRKWVALLWPEGRLNGWRVVADLPASYAKRLILLWHELDPAPLTVFPIREAGAWVLDTPQLQAAIGRAPYNRGRQRWYVAGCMRQVGDNVLLDSFFPALAH